AFLKELGAAKYDNITDQQALDAFVWLSQKEGIIPAFESSHAIAYLKKMPPKEVKDKLIIVNLSGRGDKDMIQAKDLLHFN
ncbi:MAG TPA: tryptophan synthase subunit beta, partial [Nitratifractor sp.]|nr:tryptophan synthase subunit beta [Nitratifractor sp.]